MKECQYQDILTIDNRLLFLMSITRAARAYAAQNLITWQGAGRQLSVTAVPGFEPTTALVFSAPSEEGQNHRRNCLRVCKFKGIQLVRKCRNGLQIEGFGSGAI